MCRTQSCEHVFYSAEACRANAKPRGARVGEAAPWAAHERVCVCVCVGGGSGVCVQKSLRPVSSETTSIFGSTRALPLRGQPRQPCLYG